MAVDGKLSAVKKRLVKRFCMSSIVSPTKSVI
jgi:hypothetical protein